MKKKKRLTRKAIEELNLAYGDYMLWVKLSKQYSRKALARAGLLKVAIPFNKKA